MGKYLKDLGIADGKFALEKDFMTLGRFEMIKAALPEATFPEAPEAYLYTWIDELRLVKSDDEIEKIRKSCAVTDMAMEAAIKAIKPGVTGMDIAAEAEYIMKKNGAGSWLGSHPIMIAYGELLQHAHPFAGSQFREKVENNSLITIDMGATIDGYHSDLCRTIALGDITEEEEKAVEVILKGQKAAIDAIKPGNTVADIHAAAMEALGDYKKYHYGGLIGHSVGLGSGPQALDPPFITGADPTVLEKNMVCALFEIPPFVPGVGAVRFEDTILVTDGEAELLTKYPRELIRV